MTRNTRNWMSRGLMLIVVLAVAATSSAAEFGSVKGRFVYKGTPKVVPIQPTKDPDYCGKHDIFDESVVVGDKGGLQNAFVYLYVARGKKVEIHPSYDPKTAKPKVLDNHFC